MIINILRKNGPEETLISKISSTVIPREGERITVLFPGGIERSFEVYLVWWKITISEDMLAFQESPYAVVDVWVK